MSYKIYNLGNHRIAHGDCQDKELIKELMGDNKIDLVLSDPPYACNYVESKKGFAKLACDIDIENDDITDEDEYENFIFNSIETIKPYMNDKNSFYLFNTDKMIFPLRRAMERSGLKFSQLLVWVKNSAVIGRLDYLPQHELIAYGWYGRHKFYHSKDKSVLVCPKPRKSELHSTMKPPSLLRRLILNSTKTNDIVFDGFLGSGSTLIASTHLNRRCFGVEKDARHIETIIRRWEKLTGLVCEDYERENI